MRTREPWTTEADDIRIRHHPITEGSVKGAFRGSGIHDAEFHETEFRYDSGSERGCGSRDDRLSSDDRRWSRDNRHVNSWRSRDVGLSYHYKRSGYGVERSTLKDRRDRQSRDNIWSRDNIRIRDRSRSRDNRRSRDRSRSREIRQSREYKSSRDKYSYRHDRR